MEPRNSGNVGAIARVMKNFGFSELVLVDSRCNHLSNVAKCRAKHAQDVLAKARLRKKSCLSNYDYVIGTTAIVGSDYNIPRNPLSPKELLKVIKQNKKIALLFGRESSGLTNEEIGLCDFVVTIPTNTRYPTLNISHSVAVLLYELSSLLPAQKTGQGIALVGKKEKQVIMKQLNRVLNSMEFSTKDKKETQRTLWKRLIGKSFLTRRESFALIGFLKKIK